MYIADNFGNFQIPTHKGVIQIRQDNKVARQQLNSQFPAYNKVTNSFTPLEPNYQEVQDINIPSKQEFSPQLPYLVDSKGPDQFEDVLLYAAHHYALLH